MRLGFAAVNGLGCSAHGRPDAHVTISDIRFEHWHLIIGSSPPRHRRQAHRHFDEHMNKINQES
jgi:hypothetical protein